MFAEGDSAASAASVEVLAGSAEVAVSGVGFLGSGVGLAATAAGSGAGFCMGGALVDGAGGAFASSIRDRQHRLKLTCEDQVQLVDDNTIVRHTIGFCSLVGLL